MPTLPHSSILEDIVKRAIEEDLSQGGDVTSQTVIPEDAHASAVLRTRQPGVIAGLIPSLMAFTLTDPDFEIGIHVQDGDFVNNSDIVANIDGPAQALLAAERTCLNILCHLSGIATMTAMFVDETSDTNAKITCTRKTLPGLRPLQKYAVACGGGSNHRYSLGDAILIKDNHIEVAGSVKDALDAVKNSSGHTLKIEIEVDTLDQLQEVLDHGGADIVMLDNMDVGTLEKAVKMVDGRIVTEASGGVSLDTVKHIAKSGVDYISVGALTHSSPSLDIGLDVEISK